MRPLKENTELSPTYRQVNWYKVVAITYVSGFFVYIFIHFVFL